MKPPAKPSGPDRYGVIGQPIAHSKSPWIHSQFAAQTGQDMVYERVPSPHDGFVATVTRFARDGGFGLNVTLPFKLEAFAFASRHSERAAQAGAVNTLRFDQEGVYGDNTDGVGLIRDLHRLAQGEGFGLEGLAILVIGAGGATQGILAPLLETRPERIVIANRDTAKADSLVARFGGRAQHLSVARLDGLTSERFDLVLQATAAGVLGETLELPTALIGASRLVYDLAYGDGPVHASTPFLQRACEQGARLTSDGLGMLVEQAAESFLLWRGVRPETASVLGRLRELPRDRQ